MSEPLLTTDADYQAATKWIFDRINYERVRPTTASGHFRLERMEALLGLVGSPHQRIPAVHIAGTKGKGSTAAILDSILRASGIRTGLFTSPHIHQFEERMRVDGLVPNPSELTDLVSVLRARLEEADHDLVKDGPTYFEVATILAWMYFDRCNIELAVLETGLGGRLDCTNVCQPLATAITCIGLDHTHILGDTVALIAAEKAGILKQNVPVVSWPIAEDAVDVITKRAQQLNCPQICGGEHLLVSDRCVTDSGQQFQVDTPIRSHNKLQLSLQGEHQARNAAVAIGLADLLSENDQRITPSAVARGVTDVSWPLRFEVISDNPVVILDAAHNPDAADTILSTIDETYGSSHSPRVLIFGSSTDKNALGMLKKFCPGFEAVVLTKFVTNPRAIEPDELGRLCADFHSNVTIAADPAEALAAARHAARQDGLICATGSVFLAAELRELLISE